MMHMGREGYKQNSFKIREKVEYIKDEIKKIRGLYIQGDAECSVVPIGSKSNKFTIYQLRDKLIQKRWYVREIVNPPGFHIAITNNNLGKIDEFINDIKESVK